MSSGLRDNSIIIYLRPVGDQQPYQIARAAQWLTRMRKFPNCKAARAWLAVVEDNNPWLFKTIMSQYHEANDVKQRPFKYRPINTYRTSTSNVYGQEPHMFF